MRLRVALLASALAATTAVGATVTPASATTTKPTLHGLLDRQKTPAVGYPIDAWVVNVAWADLQPTQGGPIAANNAIDQAIAQAKVLHLGIKLRVMAGINSPVWAKSLGGAPFLMHDTASASNISGLVPRFWTAPFSAAYAAFQTKLAAKYDAVAEIRETVVSQCTTIYNEPFLRQLTDPASKANLIAAGFTTALDKSCQTASIAAAKAWTTTSSDIAFNPYQSIDPGNAEQLSFPISVMDECRAALGNRCVLENNSIKPAPAASYISLYQAMQARGAPISFQTYQGLSLADIAKTVNLGAGYGAASVELPVTYRSYSAAQVTSTLASGRARLLAAV